MADDEECVERPEKILLFLSNNEVFVWDKDTVMILRQKYRIVGSLVGSLPSKPRQNLVYSLPLVLLPEEARLLLDMNIAKIVQSDVSTSTREAIEKFQDERKASIQKQIARLKEMKQQKLEDFAKIIEEGREKTTRKRKMLSQDSSRKLPRIETEKSESCIQSHSLQADVPILKELEENCASSESNEGNLQDSTLVCVGTQAEIRSNKDVCWKFPETEIEQARCKVFSDLWKKGYYITNGNKFGGDYLVYPGDPLRLHSHFIVKVLPWKQKLTGLDVVSVGRLGSSVKKTNVLASVDSSGKVIYTSVQWSGFS